MILASPMRYLTRVWVDTGGRSLSSDMRLIASAQTAAGATQFRLQTLGELNTATGRMYQKMALISDDDSWVVSFGETIDVSYTFQEDDSAGAALTFEAFAARCEQTYAALLNDEIVAIRLATVREGLAAEMTEATFRAVADRMLNRPPTFRENSWEWDWRCVTTIDRQFGGSAKATNTIASVKRGSGTFSSGESFERLRIDLDINTRNDPSMRFRVEEVSAFFNSIVAWHRELETEIQTFAGVS